jgi:hypothetical protein
MQKRQEPKGVQLTRTSRPAHRAAKSWRLIWYGLALEMDVKIGLKNYPGGQPK